MSASAPDHEVNIRSAGFFVARRPAACLRCREPISLIAVALPQGHSTLDPDTDGWEIAALNAFTFYMGYLPDDVGSRLKQYSSSFRLAYSEQTLDTYWANHCERCASLQPDHDLFCEPGGAFAPISKIDAAAIELAVIEAPFEASAAGYAYQPEFFGFMRRF